jgi:hypothetical protein
MKKVNTIFWGIVLVLVGLAIILVQIDVIDLDWGYLWPAGMLLLAILFHIQFFASPKNNVGVLVPGGILLVYGALFMYMRIAGWYSAGSLWPIFLVGPGFGLMELRLFSRGKQGSWIPVIILFSLAIFLFIRDSFSSLPIAFGTALIIIGIIIVIVTVFDRKGKPDKNNVDNE